MRMLHFTVDGLKLYKSGDFSNIVRGTKGYLKCHFEFKNGDWFRHKVVAVFEVNGKEHAVPVNAGYCMVPDEVTDFSSFKIKMVGAMIDRRIITNKVLIEQEG